MQRSLKRLDELYRFLASKRFAVILFLLICLSLVPGTLAESDFRLSGPSRILFGCLVLNLVLCTLQRWGTLPRPVLVLHLGSIVIAAGMVISSFGYIATVNIYEGAATRTAYRWDKEADLPLGFDLGVRAIHREYYPSAVKVGVLKGEEKAGLFELKTGGWFSLGDYSVRADVLEVPSEVLKLSILRGDRLLAATDSESPTPVLPEFPYTFKLVAFKQPVLKRVWVDIELAQGAETVAAGTSEVNGPFHWNGLSFYCTAIDSDEYGNDYAGIQIVKDPGRSTVFTGFAVVMAGCLYWVYGKFTGRKAAARLAGVLQRFGEEGRS